MKSRIDFESITIEDLLLDQAGVQILTKMEIILDKLMVHEVSSPLERDVGMIKDLSVLLDKTHSLKERYQENVKSEKERTDEMIKVLDEVSKKS